MGIAIGQYGKRCRMRLIDADALIKELDRKHYSMASRKQIYSQPTIDAVPVVRGHWVPRCERIREPFGKNYDCSVCGVNNIQYNFCPNCGADMRGEERCD